jgi:hypothetical protein
MLASGKGRQHLREIIHAGATKMKRASRDFLILADAIFALRGSLVSMIERSSTRA